jgi:hypothetical protein
MAVVVGPGLEEHKFLNHWDLRDSPREGNIDTYRAHISSGSAEEEEEEEDLFVFNDTIEGPRAPAVKPGRVTQA